MNDHDLVPVRRALISVSEKSGVVEFATALNREFGVELISTGGTAKILRDNDLRVLEVSDLTGFPEMMDGRVKTLHPKIHAGILAVRDDDGHVASMRDHGIAPIELVCINLYPFQETIARPEVSLAEAIEQIDIGGPALIRSAAKNYRYVLVVTSPDRYEKVLGDLREHGGSCCGKHRFKQALCAFAHTAAYDAAIAEYFARHAGTSSESIILNLSKKLDLRYGENPHQRAALYAGARPNEASVAFAKQLHGKELSYTNLLDADAALSAVKELATPAACIVKHATPCGYATADELSVAFRNAFDGDPLAAFGGIVAFNKRVDLGTAQSITATDTLLEVIVAPGFEADALELLRARWKNVRLLDVGDIDGTNRDPREFSMHKITGGYLLQDRDGAGVSDETGWRVVSARHPSTSEQTDLRLAWSAARHVKSNAIVIAKNRATVGIGGGCVDRVGACRVAVQKAAVRAAGAVAASDGFFPFPDGPQLLLDAGVTAIIQPGGSVRDRETIDMVNARGAAMIFTGRRHFRH
jgi:phosphoribosylaminoimidazolecarboxamide formyltransferase/IMP cyclohydrolase